MELYDGPHLYPFVIIDFLIREGRVVPSAGTLPFGWRPTHTRPRSDLLDAFTKMDELWDEVFKRSPELFRDEVEEPAKVLKNNKKGMGLSTIGLWNSQERLRWSAKTTTVDSDMSAPVKVMTFDPDGTQIKYCAT